MCSNSSSDRQHKCFTWLSLKDRYLSPESLLVLKIYLLDMMVVKGAAVKSHLQFISAGFLHQTAEVKAFFHIGKRIHLQVSLCSWNAENTVMEIPEMPNRYFPLMKENQGMCHAPKCWIPEEILSLLDFLQLEKVNLGGDPVKSRWNSFCPRSKLFSAGRKPGCSQAVKAVPYSRWQRAWPSECFRLPCK